MAHDASRVPADGSAAGRPRAPVRFAVVLAGAMAVSAFPNPALGVLAPFLLDDLSMSRTQLGWAVTGFVLVTAVAAPLTGRLVDRLGGRQVLLAVLGLAICCMVLIGASIGFAWLFAFVCLAGVQHGAVNPATNDIIVNSVPPGRRGLVMGIKQSGVQGGFALVSLMLPALALVVGWRWSLIALALIALVALAIAARMVPDVGRREASDRQRRWVLENVGIRWLTLFSFLMGAGGSVIIAFLPLYLNEQLAFSPALAGVAAFVVAAVGTVARIVLGHQVEGVERFGPVLSVIALGAALAGAAVVLAGEFGAWLIWVGAVIAGLTVASWNVVAMMAAVVVSAREQVGAATGMVILGFMGGMAASPVLFGWTVDRTDSYVHGWSGVIGMFLAAAVAMVIWDRSSGKRPAAAA